MGHYSFQGLRENASGLWLLFLIVVTLPASSARAVPFDITIVFGGGLSPSQEAIFAQAESTWEFLITGYAPGVTVSGLTINASGVTVDGPGGILGSAGPTLGQWDSGILYATEGGMQFDSADLLSMETGNTLEAVILHEMAHVIGFGTLWDYNGLYDGSGNYTGFYGVSAYQTEFGQAGAASIPVELSGGAGTAGGHWDESYGGGSNTGITNPDGIDMRHELMTGWLNAPTFISRTTIQQFRDLGYTVIPEPGTALLLISGLAALSHRRRERRAGRAL